MTPAMRTTAVLLGLSTREGDIGSEDNSSFARFFKLDNTRDGDTGNEDNSSFARFFKLDWYGDVPGARSTRDGDTGNEDNSSFARFLKLARW